MAFKLVMGVGLALNNERLPTKRKVYRKSARLLLNQARNW